MRKIFSVYDAKAHLSECIELAQSGNIIVTSHGKPVAIIAGIRGYDLEDILTASDPKFWKMIQERRSQRTMSSQELRHSLGLPPQQPARRQTAKTRRRPKRMVA